MPVVFSFISMNFPSGLVLYWLVNNLLTMGPTMVHAELGRCPREGMTPRGGCGRGFPGNLTGNRGEGARGPGRFLVERLVEQSTGAARAGERPIRAIGLQHGPVDRTKRANAGCTRVPGEPDPLAGWVGAAPSRDRDRRYRSVLPSAEALEELARRTESSAIQTGRPVELSPMTPRGRAGSFTWR